MKIALINSFFSQDAGPPILPLELAYCQAALSGHQVTIRDLNLEVYQHFNADIVSYHLLACVFGGYTFSFPLSAFVPFNEFPFEAVPTIELLIAAVYGEEGIDGELHCVSERFGLPPEETRDLFHGFLKFTKDVVDTLTGFDLVIMNMPSPASVTPGLMLGHYLRNANPAMKMIGVGNQINVPEVANLAFAMGIFDAIGPFDRLERTLAAVGIPAGTCSFEGGALPDVTGFETDSYPVYYGLRIIPFETARGCPSRCNFCSERLVWDYQGEVVDRFIQKPLDKVMGEIAHVKNNLNLSGLTFNDCMLNADYERCEDLMLRLADTGILFSGSVRVDRLHDRMIQMMQQARLTNVIVGVETLSPESVRLYQKGGRDYANKAWEVIPALFGAGIIPQLNILICHPYETLDDVHKAIESVATFADFLSQQGIPFFDAPVGTVCINYPSETYFRVLQDPDFEIIYHDLPASLHSCAPSVVAEAVRKIPWKAIKKSAADNAKMNKVDLTASIYQLWSKDRQKILQTKVSALARHKEFILNDWRRYGVSVKTLRSEKFGPVQSETPLARVFELLDSLSRPTVHELWERTDEASRGVLVSALLTLSMGGLVELQRGGRD